jgi:uncharacterized membrane protein (GlpM family)
VLALKLLLIPSFLAALSLAGRRWGPSVAGWLAGLPLVGGPILFFLSIERGAQFGADAAAASLSAVLASLSFNTAYAWASLRMRWPVALATAVATWFAAALVLAQLPSSVWIASAVALCALLAAPRLLPAAPPLPALRPLPRGDLAARMAAGVALTLLVTAAAPQIGPTWSGLLGVFPVLGLVLSTFSHAGSGAPFTVVLLHAMARGMWSFASFCFCLALALPTQGIAAAFALSAALSLCVQWFAQPRRSRRRRSARCA